MPYFLDTNVITGYVLLLDPWYELANALFRKDKDIHSSNTVKLEFEKVTKFLLKSYRTFLVQINNELTPEQILTEKNFIKMVKNIQLQTINSKKLELNQETVGHLIWETGGWYEDTATNEIIQIINDLIIQFNTTFHSNCRKCKNLLKFHNRTKEYSEILSKFNQLRLANNKIHYPDNMILLDAHDLALQKTIFKFITSDLKLLAFKEDILKLTEINDMVSLQSFLST